MLMDGRGNDSERKWFKLTVAYDGTAYCGWQAQRGQRTIQDELERALQKITRQEVRAVASGRTDSGVHAQGQVVSFEAHTTLSTETLLRALNGHLPADIAVGAIEQAPPGFHATYDAVGKLYRYVLRDGPRRDVFQQCYCWQYPQLLDDGAMHAAAQGLLGTHDFRSFESQWPNRQTSVRTLSRLEVTRDGGFGPDAVTVEAYADGFLYNMVRALVGTLVEVGRGKRPVEWPAEVRAALNRGRAGITAPPRGLYLVQVDFPPAEELALRGVRRLAKAHAAQATADAAGGAAASEAPE